MNIFLNAVSWTEESAKTLGLPRPIFKVSEDLRRKPVGSSLVSKTKLYLHKEVPIPWQTKPVFTNEKQLDLIIDHEESVYKDGRCAFCGIFFNNNDIVIRWKTIKNALTKVGPNVFSDNYPFHLECMKQGRKFCPFMRTTKDSEYEVGNYLELKGNAIKIIKHFI
jgi:hypothetical protein